MQQKQIIEDVIELQSEHGASIQDILEGVKLLLKDFKDGTGDETNEDNFANARFYIDQAISEINKIDKVL